MTAIGGFFELELASRRPSYHPEALALCSGRAGLRCILETIKPRHVWVPFFVCDAALIPLETLGIPYTFYALTKAFEPDLSGPVPDDDCFLYVNYFGLKTEYARSLPDTIAAKVIIDDTQAFYQRGYTHAWSFNSARKFFGVPDGGYAYGSGLLFRAPLPPLEGVRYDHLLNRLLGNQELAFRQYVESEQQVKSDIIGPSMLAQRLLGGIDYQRVLETRRRNFASVHQRLGDINRVSIDLNRAEDSVPYCYPFFPARKVEFERLWQRQIFFPRLWPDVVRREALGFERERDIAAGLIPLPVDQRYGAEEMSRMCDTVIEEIG